MTDRNSRVRQRIGTSRYVANREAVLGRRFTVSVDPELAAEQLAEHVGGRQRALQWATDLLAALERWRSR